MKDNLFDMLMNLFEKSLTQIQKNERPVTPQDDPLDLLADEEFSDLAEPALYVKAPNSMSHRVFTYEEQMKLTKASYQFLMRMKVVGVLDADQFETILGRLFNSESRIVTLEETKWTIRNVLSENLTEKQLIFLDLVLYQKEDELTLQ